jgi:hypothetical protein
MTTTSGSLVPKIRLYNPSGTLLASNYSGNPYGCGGTTVQLNSVTLPAGGTYTVLVGDCSDTNTGNYNLSSECFGTCPMSTTTTLSSSPNPSVHGQAVTFTAVVSSGAGTPPNGETVSFMKGKVVLGTGTLSDGSATFMTSTLPVGTNSITAVYGGDANFGGSTSNVVKQVVEKTAE